MTLAKIMVIQHNGCSFKFTIFVAMPYLELSVEGLRFKKVCTNSTVSIDLALESIKAFIFESNEDLSSVSDIQQVLFLSGPEPKTPKKG